MDFNRRTFLTSLIGGTVLTVAQPALALAPDRYRGLIEILRGLDETMTKWGWRVAEPAKNRILKYEDAPEGFKKEINLRFDHALLWAMEQFPERQWNEHTQSQIKALFNRTLVIDVLSEHDLRRVEDATVCIATARYMLGELRAPVHTGKSTAFETFAGRYRKFILPTA